MTAPDDYLDAGGPPDRDRDALFDDMVSALKYADGQLRGYGQIDPVLRAILAVEIARRIGEMS